MNENISEKKCAIIVKDKVNVAKLSVGKEWAK